MSGTGEDETAAWAAATREPWNSGRTARPREVPPGPHRGSIVGLLAPELRCVPYTRRRAELAELLRWCREKYPVQVRLLTGAGGAGKTRLALEASRRLARTGWHRVWIRADEDVTERLRSAAGRRILVVIDDAMARMDLAELLDCLPVPHGGRLRILTISRDGGDWWHRLSWASALWTAQDLRSSHQHLEPLGDDDAQAFVKAAERAFARALGVVSQRLVLQPSHQPVLPLDLHAAVLATALESAERWPAPRDGLPVPVEPDRALGVLLDRERTRWAREAPLPNIDADDLDDAVAVGVMLGTTSGTTVVHVLNRVLPARADVTRLGSDIGPVGLVIGMPHRMIQLHVARKMATAPWLVVEWLRDLSPDVAYRVALLVHSLLVAPPPEFDREHAERVLGRVVEEMPGEPQALAAVLHLLVQEREPLAGPVEAITARLLDLGPGVTGTRRAEVLTYRARALRALGRDDEAIRAGTEAVSLWRAAHAGDARRYRAVLEEALAEDGPRHRVGGVEP